MAEWDTPTAMAGALERYPNSSDVWFARKNDMSYGQGWAPYFEGKRFNRLSGGYDLDPKGAVPTKEFDVTNSHAPFIQDYYARGALAANRSPLAALGFDPTKAAVDLNERPVGIGRRDASGKMQGYNLYGQYKPAIDQVYAFARNPSTIVHESIHRGTKLLSGSPYWKKEFNEFGLPQRENNEALVRYLMHNKVEPETSEQGLEYVNRVAKNSRQVDLVNAMEAAAAQYIAKRKPGGPR